MGKKGTKRKTKWRALPLGEEAGGSGNEEDLHDEDQSTTSSTAGGQFANNAFKRPPFYYKMADKSYRQTRRFTYERFRGKEPLVKLESKTFDEEEYTKITTPRQDVLFKKGYFGRKRESSVEESTALAGEVDGEEPLMDQIIITNGFVDERGHYLVNGNSYEIYDPYSNTVTVVVGPPPYANGVTHPVLAAVSCHPVPLQPVDWYPPGADWPSQGSAWTPSYPRNPPDSLNSPECPPNFPSPDAQPPAPYDHPPFLVPAYMYSESPVYNGVPLQTNPPTEAQNAEENGLEVKKTANDSTEPAPEGEPKQSNEETPEIVAQEKSEIAPATPLPSSPQQQGNVSPTGETELLTPEHRPKVEKQSHSTQTNLLEDTAPPKGSGKESHSTQTPSEYISRSSNAEAQPKSNKTPSDIPLPPAKPEADTKPAWKPRYNTSVKKFREESPKKIYQQRTNFAEERKTTGEKPGCSPIKVSYAKKAMSGLENASPKVTNARMTNGGLKTTGPVMNGVQGSVGANGTNRPKQGCEEKRNGFVKPRYNRGRTTSERSWQKYKKPEANGWDEANESKCEEVANGSRSPSEKSSTVSELSSPAELSSGQNTPPEKLIVQKMEQEINKSFEVKLKQNLTKTENAEKQLKEDKVEEDKMVEDVREEDQVEEEKVEDGQVEGDKVEEDKGEEVQMEVKSPGKSKGKKKKNKGKSEAEKPKADTGKSGKRKKKKEEVKGKPEVEESGDDMAFLSDIRQKEFFFGWEGLKEEGKELISDMGSFLNGDEEILKFLGLDGRMSYSKLPLHSDLMMILPTIGWSRPKLKIEDFFAPSPYSSDLFTKRNITNMKSTKPEEFFASVVDNPVVEKPEKKKEPGKKANKPEETSTPGKKNGSKTGCKKAVVEKPSEEKKEEAVGQEGKLRIVEAVNTWLQEQGDEKVLSVDNVGALMREEGKEEEEEEEEESGKKNGVSNPMHALSAEGGGAKGNGCIRVANVVSDGFVHVSGEFPGRGRIGRMYRSSSWDTMLSEVKIKKHFKFLTDSASFCQDLISDVRNGLPVGNEYATEELCDPKQIVRKYYTLAPSVAGRLRSESDSENEVFDALEYKFLPKEKQDAVANGKASITDSGVHSDVELSEDASPDNQKEKTCKLQ